MRRWSALCAVLFAGILLHVTPAQADRLERKTLNWRTSALNSAGYVDSTTASINGAVQTTDTTTAGYIGDTDWFGLSASPATAHGCLRVKFETSSASPATDSLFVAAETASGPNGPWASNTTFIAAVGVSGDKYLTLPILCDSDAVGTTGTGTIWMQDYIRFRVRADGNTAAIFLGATVTVTVPVR